MYFPRLIVTSFTLILLLLCPTFAQTSPTESKTENDEAREELKKQAYKLLDEALSEAESLKLWENRALAFAMAGDLIWKKDQKQARALFRQSADQILLGNVQPKERSGRFYEEYYYWQQRSPRRVILLMVASHDADLALEILKETRPAELQTAIDAKNVPAPKGKKKTALEIRKNRQSSYRVNEEINLEQQFAVKAAEQNPGKAAEIIRESLKKGVSRSALNLVQKVNKKDQDLAKQLLGEILDKLMNSQFDENFNNELSIAQRLLVQNSRPDLYKTVRPPNLKDEKLLKLEEKDLRALANKIADHYLKTNKINSFYRFTEVIPDLKKYVPAKTVAIEKKGKRNKKTVARFDERISGCDEDLF